MARPVMGALFLALVCTTPTRGDDTPPSPERAAARMTLPKGFHIKLVAGEPRLVKPIAMTTDDRGRLWVVESHSYPHWLNGVKEGHDRILIFEDAKGTGHYDCKVFWDKGTNLSGLTLGFGGVWLCATPNLLFIPVRPGEVKPAGPPVVVLDGWSLQAQHNVFNTLKWGPDGWLYGCNGILATSHVAKPGTPAAERIPFNCGVWRYHPVRKKFEVFAWGTTNPWGLDFDDYGEMFITNCVIKHLFHVVPGAHFQRMYGPDLNPYCFGLMESCADHIHWAGGDWTTSRGGLGAHNKPGGGHAHAGAMVYLGDNWPASNRHHIFMCNLHGSRVNQDVLERRGSGYVAHHGPDFLMANDPWFRGLALICGPDGGVYVSDWHDTGECHNHDKVHPSGRIYKVTYGQPAIVRADLAKMDDEALVKLQLHKNDWWVRHARRLLQERAHAGKLAKTVRPLLLKMLAEQEDVTRKLRALWALYVIGGADEKVLIGLLQSPEELVRRWAVRLLVDRRPMSALASSRLVQMAQGEKSQAVRLALASALQRISLIPGLAIAAVLASHGEDARDTNLPLMIWYGIESLAASNLDRSAELFNNIRIPLVRQFLARRIALVNGKGTDALNILVQTLMASPDRQVQRDIMRGMADALRGQREVVRPRDWAKVYRKLNASPDAEVREKILVLSVLFGDSQALLALHDTAAKPNGDVATRRRALQALVEKQAQGTLPLLRELLPDPKMCGPALHGLAAFNDPDTPALILRHYASFTDADKADAISTLASRPKYARALLEAMEKGTVRRRDLSAFTARQLVGFKDKALTARLNKVWGTIRQPAQDRTALLAKYKALVTPAALGKADRAHGRAVFARTCASCHTLFDAGAKIGPDLTGSQRTNPEYILTKVLDPNAVVPSDYQVTRITTAGGRVISGIIKEETEKTIAIQTPTELVRLPKTDIDERTKLGMSLMPEGQLGQMTDAEVRDLIAYLAGPRQVPLPGPHKKLPRPVK